MTISMIPGGSDSFAEYFSLPTPIRSSLLLLAFQRLPIQIMKLKQQLPTSAFHTECCHYRGYDSSPGVLPEGLGHW